MVNLQRLTPGKRAVILGTEAVAFSSALTLKHANMSIVGMVEEFDAIQTYQQIFNGWKIKGRVRKDPAFGNFSVYSVTL
jgi:S-adenosylhomocysteine hydrolase